MLIKTFLIAGLLFTFYQDMRYRAVYWVLFPFLLALMIIIAMKQQTITELAMQSSYNLAFLALQFILLFVYFSIKSRKPVNLTSGYLGWGDILFLLCISFYLSPLNYLLFYVLSLCTVLLSVLIVIVVRRSRDIKVPLAGIQALLFAFILSADWIIDSINLTNDYWLINYLSI